MNHTTSCDHEVFPDSEILQDRTKIAIDRVGIA